MRVPSLALAALLAGCGSIFGPGEERVVGIIGDFATDTPAIEVPSTVRAGENVTVTIHTGWRNGCARKGATEVQARGASVTVTPYDIVQEGGTCTQAPQQFTHTATFRFARPGTAQVLVRGRPSRDGRVSTRRHDVTVK